MTKHEIRSYVMKSLEDMCYLHCKDENGKPCWQVLPSQYAICYDEWMAPKGQKLIAVEMMCHVTQYPN